MPIFAFKGVASPSLQAVLQELERAAKRQLKRYIHRTHRLGNFDASYRDLRQLDSN